MLEQLAIEFKSDGGDVAALFRAEQISRAANFQIAHGDLETAAERGVLLHGADAFAHVGEQARVARQQQIRVGLMLVTPDAPAQLVKVAQTKTVGAVNDDGVRIRNVETAFDDRRGKQNVGLAVDEFRHHFFEVVGIHLAVADDESRVGAKFFQTVGHVLNRHHAVVQEKNLSAAREFAVDGVADGALVELRDDRLDGQAVVRRRLDGAHVARAGEREVKRARNRRGAQRQHVHERAETFEFFLVQHAEALLLVNHDEAEVFENNVVLHDAMRADDNVNRASRQIFDDFLLLALGAKAREQLDANRIIRHAFAEIVEMLLRENGRRHENRNLFSAHHGLERGANGDFRFAKTNVAANQTIHWLGVFHVGLGFGNRA